MTDTRDAETELNAAIDDTILGALADGDSMPYAVLLRIVRLALEEPEGVPNRIHVLERCGLIESRIWGQGDERQLWLRKVNRDAE